MTFIPIARTVLFCAVLSVAPALFAQGNEAQLRRAISAPPFLAQNYLNLSRYLEKQGKWREAIEVLKEGLEKTFRSAALHQELAHIFAAQKQYGPAADHFESALKMNPSSGDLRHNVAAARLKQGFEALELRNYVEAHFLLERARELEPNLPGVSYALGLAHFKQGNPEGAVRFLKKAV